MVRRLPAQSRPLRGFDPEHVEPGGVGCRRLRGHRRNATHASRGR